MLVSHDYREDLSLTAVRNCSVLHFWQFNDRVGAEVQAVALAISIDMALKPAAIHDSPSAMIRSVSWFAVWEVLSNTRLLCSFRLVWQCSKSRRRSSPLDPLQRSLSAKPRIWRSGMLWPPYSFGAQTMRQATLHLPPAVVSVPHHKNARRRLSIS
jgi:hypothetical protein